MSGYLKLLYVSPEKLLSRRLSAVSCSGSISACLPSTRPTAFRPGATIFGPSTPSCGALRDAVSPARPSLPSPPPPTASPSATFSTQLDLHEPKVFLSQLRPAQPQPASCAPARTGWARCWTTLPATRRARHHLLPLAQALRNPLARSSWPRAIKAGHYHAGMTPQRSAARRRKPFCRTTCR